MGLLVATQALKFLGLDGYLFATAGLIVAGIAGLKREPLRWYAVAWLVGSQLTTVLLVVWLIAHWSAWVD